MRESAYKTLFLAVGIIFSIMLFAGCEEEEKIPNTMNDAPPDVKRSRLIAVENEQLKAQIEKLKILHTREMKKQERLHSKEKGEIQQRLDVCIQEQKVLDEISKKGIENYMQDILGSVSEENAKLQEEIKTLKAQVEELKAELEELKRPKVVPL
ncbi:MAG: hypothetical protein ACYS67_06340 [Planctomycetota bacterium]|jgi:uncharacterized protein (DUF3084 family)